MVLTDSFISLSIINLSFTSLNENATITQLTWALEIDSLFQINVLYANII